MNNKLTIFLSFLLFSIAAIAQPKIEIVGGNTYNWGDVKLSQETLEASIQIKNVGTEELIIQNVKPSCGCTTAPLDKDKLAPGEMATLDVKMKISKGGKTRKNIRISSNDPETPQTNLQIAANVIELITVIPTNIFRFKDLEVGKESESSVSIMNKDDKPVKISSLNIKPENLILVFKDSKGNKMSGNAVIAPGEKLDVIATVTPQKDGYFRASVDLKTDHPDHQKISINGYGNVKESAVFNNN